MASKDASGLTSSFWTSSAKDDLKATDIYSLKDSSVVTSIQSVKSTISETNKSIIDLVRGGKNIADKVSTAKSVLSSVQSALSAKDTLTKVLTSTNALKSGLTQLGLDNDITTNILGAITDGGKITTTVNGITKEVSSAKLTDINSVSKLMDSFTGGVNTILTTDIDTKVGTAVGLVGSAGELGVSGTFESVSKAFGVNTTALKSFAAKCLPDTIKTSDTDNLMCMAKVSGDGGLTQINPSLFSDFSSVYKSTNEIISDSVTKYSKLKTTFDTVDSNWVEKERVSKLSSLVGSSGTVSTISFDDSGEVVVTPVSTEVPTIDKVDTAINVTPVINGSDDFKTTITNGIQSATSKVSELTSDAFLAFGSLFKPTTVTETTTLQFPYTVVNKPIDLNNYIKEPTSSIVKL